MSSEGHEKSNLWLIIYTDMVSNLMIFFLMLYCLTWMSADDRKIAAASFEEAFGGRKGLVQQTVKGINKDRKSQAEEEKRIEEQVKEEFTNVEINEHRIKIILPSPVLFDSGSADLKPQTLSTLTDIARIIRESHNYIVVEGHTDDTPFAASSYRSNWELSSNRALSVVRFFVEREGIDPAQISALGYGEFRPKVPNTSEGNRAINRRIEISIIKAK
jgi:chemotaxis protein MotB